MRPLTILAALALVACGPEDTDTGTPEKPECDFTNFDDLAHSSGQVTGTGATQGLAYWGSDTGQDEVIYFTVSKIEEGTYEFGVPASYVDMVVWTGVTKPANPAENHEVEYQVDSGTVEVTEAMAGISQDKFSAIFHDVKLIEEGADDPRTWCFNEFEFSVKIDTGP